MDSLPIAIPLDRVAEFCKRNGISRLSLFGSVLRDDFRAASDVDCLVEFVPGARVSLFDLGGMAVELSQLLGRQVDLRTPEDLSRYFRSAVLREAKLLYAA
jgi:predicted nucleotidyltransferase